MDELQHTFSTTASNRRGWARGAWVCIWMLAPSIGLGAGPWGWGQPTDTQPATTQPEVAVTTTAPAEEEPELKPRFELHVPSVRTLFAETKRSHCGFVMDQVGRMLVEAGSASAEGVDVDEAAAILDQVKTWPDTPVDLVTFARDTVGRLRWAIRVDWPLDDLRSRIQSVLEMEGAETILKDVTLSSADDGAYPLALSGSTLAWLIGQGETRSLIASHQDLEFPETPFTGSEAAPDDRPPLLACRLNLGQTEKDSGATFFSSFSAVTGVVYSGRVNPAGDWVETVNVEWPPVVGMGAKAFFDKVKPTFYVPDEAFGGLTLASLTFPGLLEQMANLKVENDSQPGLLVPPQAGPIAERADDAVCFTVLPGTGFLPAPDLVAQTRVKSPEKLVEEIREATRKINEKHRDRDEPEPWQEVQVRGRAVFWSNESGRYRGQMMPLSYRPVVFLTQETDAGGRQRDFLIVAMTSTTPEDLVRRWLDLPRPADRRFLPSVKRPHGEAWVNWRQLYRWVVPYLNVGLSGVAFGALLPDADEIGENLTDASVTLHISYGGLSVAHEGPVPAGVLAVPVLFSLATTEDRSGGSNLARERQASRQLQVLYHHAKLFQKDQGRWPAEVAELDGYVDFAGHPELLKVRLSAKKRWGEWFKDVLGADEEAQEDQEDADEESGLDDSIYVIDWPGGSWRLGYAPGTFEHLEALYVDESGSIHRVEKTKKNKAAGSPNRPPPTAPE
jgi:hypothetical protein